MVIFRSQQIEDPSGQHPAATIFLIQLRKPLRPLGKCLDSSQLQRLEHSRIHLALHFQNLSYDLGISRHNPDSLASHIVGLAQ
jgi:hypothetical protein